MQIFSNRLKELRLSGKLSQTALAELLSVDQRSISNWENNVREPDFEMLAKIAKIFNTSTDYLLGLSDD